MGCCKDKFLVKNLLLVILSFCNCQIKKNLPPTWTIFVNKNNFFAGYKVTSAPAGIDWQVGCNAFLG